MVNLKLIQDQPRWRVATIHWLARLVGVMVHVEGIPFGSRRNYRPCPIDHGPRARQFAVAVDGHKSGALI